MMCSIHLKFMIHAVYSSKRRLYSSWLVGKGKIQYLIYSLTDGITTDENFVALLSLFHGFPSFPFLSLPSPSFPFLSLAFPRCQTAFPCGYPLEFDYSHRWLYHIKKLWFFSTSAKTIIYFIFIVTIFLNWTFPLLPVRLKNLCWSSAQHNSRIMNGFRSSAQ